MTRFAASSPTSALSRRRRTDGRARGAARAILILSALASPAPWAWARDEDLANIAFEAQFAGCDAAGWCRFALDASPGSVQALLRVRPVGVADARADPALARKVRDRLNAVLSSMIHQHKRIRLSALRELGDGTYAAIVTVNDADVAADPALQDLRASPATQ
jgi:hypothetical protein